MRDALVLNLPVELGLELVAVVRPQFADTEGDALDEVVEEFYGVEMTKLDQLPVLYFKDQDLDVDLNMVSRDPFLGAGGVDFTVPCSPRQSVQAMLENKGYAGTGHLYVLAARKVPDDTHKSQVVGLM